MNLLKEAEDVLQENRRVNQNRRHGLMKTVDPTQGISKKSQNDREEKAHKRTGLIWSRRMNNSRGWLSKEKADVEERCVVYES